MSATRPAGPGEGELLAVLALGPGAAEEDIHTAYRRLAMRYHPDSSGDPATARHFARVVRAYKVLSAHPSSPAAASPPSGRYRRVLEAGDDLFALGQVLASEPDPGAREATVRQLGLTGRSAAFVFLRRALYDASPQVALAAVRAAALIGSRQAEGEVAALYCRAGEALRTGILEVAEATGERLFRSTLVAAAADADPGRQARARHALAALDPSPESRSWKKTPSDREPVHFASWDAPGASIP